VKGGYSELADRQNLSNDPRQPHRVIHALAEEDDLDKVTTLVDSIFTVLQKAAAT